MFQECQGLFVKNKIKNLKQYGEQAGCVVVFCIDSAGWETEHRHTH